MEPEIKDKNNKINVNICNVLKHGVFLKKHGFKSISKSDEKNIVPNEIAVKGLQRSTKSISSSRTRAQVALDLRNKQEETMRLETQLQSSVKTKAILKMLSRVFDE